MIKLEDIGYYDFSFTQGLSPSQLTTPKYKNFDKLLPLTDSSFSKFNFNAGYTTEDVDVFNDTIEFEASAKSGLDNVDMNLLFRDLYPRSLGKNMLSNLEEAKIQSLNYLQEYMFTLCCLDQPFVLYGDMKSGRQTGYLLPLLEKLSQAKEGRPTKWEGPSMLIVTFTEQRARHISLVLEKLIKGLRVKSVSMLHECDFSLVGADVYISRISHLTDFIKKNEVDLSVTDYLIIEECNKASNPDYAQKLNKLHHIFSRCSGIPYQTYLIYEKYTKMEPVLEGFHSDRHSILKFHKSLKTSSFHVHVVMFYEKSKWLNYRKMRALQKQLISSDAMEFETKENRWLIFTSSASSVNYLCGYLSNRLRAPPIPLTMATDQIGIENATGNFRERHNVMIAEYAMIDKIPESGYIGNIICFDLPETHLFFQYLTKMKILARNVKGNLCIFFNPLIDVNKTPEICKFLRKCKEPLSKDLHDLVEWHRQMMTKERIRGSYPLVWAKLKHTESLPKFYHSDL